MYMLDGELVPSVKLISSAQLRYEMGGVSAELSFDGTPQDIPDDMQYIYPLHDIYELHTEDGSNRHESFWRYPRRHNDTLAAFYEKSGPGITSYPLRVAMIPFDRDAQLYLIYSFVDADDTWWSLDPIPFTPGE